ncbi:MAG: DUF1533 domain-containing protein [Clostridia bacterium]|nr:DUF1533 domain-containing protein [Clostridia bacterium]
MKKLIALMIALMLAAALGTAMAEEATVYGTATLTYAEFYAGDVSSVDSIDVVTSATTGKSGTFSNTVSDFVDEETSKDGYHLTGIANVNVAVKAEDVEAYKAINPTFVEAAEAPSQYKPVSLEDGKAVYGATVFNIAATVSDAEIEVVTDSHWGDYQLNIVETSTQNIRNARSDDGFAVGSGIQGIIVETKSGLKVGMEHLQSIWVQPWEISWNVTVDNSHNDELKYDNLAELDKLMGETVNRVLFINQNDAYAYEFEGAYLPIKTVSGMSVENAESASLETSVSVNGLGEGYQEHYAVKGLDVTVADGKMTWEKDIPGAYTLVLTDDSGVYALLSAPFVLSSDMLPVAFDADNGEVVAAEGYSDELLQAFLANLTTVTVNGKEYNASGRGAVVIINDLGELDTEAAVTSGRGADAVVTPVFEESGSYEITLKATGFNNVLTFTAEVTK